MFIAGLFTGLISAFFGVGGGVVIVPALYHLYPDLSPHIIISTSTGLIMFLATLNAVNFYRAKKRIDYKIVLYAGISSLITGILFTFIAGNFSKKTLTIILGSYYLMLAIRLLFDQKKPIQSNEFKFDFSLQNKLKLIFTGAVGGAVAGITGLGGGTVMIPFFIYWINLPMDLVSVYSNNVMIYSALGCVLFSITQTPILTPDLMEIGRFQLGLINTGILLGIFSGALLTSPLGVKISLKTSPHFKKIAFILMLTFLGVKSLIFS